MKIRGRPSGRCSAVGIGCVVLAFTLLLGSSSFGQPLTLEIEDVVVGSSTGPISAGVILTHPGPGNVDGFWVGICWDEDAHLVLESMVLGPAVAALDGGMGPEIFLVDEDPIGGSGVTCGTVLSFTGDVFLPPGFSGEILRMTYTYSGVPAGDIILEFCDDLGEPPLVTQVIIGGMSSIPVQLPGVISFPAPPEVPFVRGDLDENGNLDVADALGVLGFLFSGAALTCAETADVDASGGIDVADAVALLSYLFVSGSPPAFPFPNCSSYPMSPLGCVAYDACP